MPLFVPRRFLERADKRIVVVRGVSEDAHDRHNEFPTISDSIRPSNGENCKFRGVSMSWLRLTAGHGVRIPTNASDDLPPSFRTAIAGRHQSVDRVAKQSLEHGNVHGGIFCRLCGMSGDGCRYCYVDDGGLGLADSSQMLAIAAHPLLLPLVSRPSLSRHCDFFPSLRTRHYETNISGSEESHKRLRQFISI
jgi:hypothetical protein